MEAALEFSARYIALVLDAVAILMIALGAVEAVFGILRAMFSAGRTNADKRHVWLDFASWLVAALTFQLAADIVETTVAPGWEDIGRVAAIAAIRTALTFFLDRDIEATRSYQNERSEWRAKNA